MQYKQTPNRIAMRLIRHGTHMLVGALICFMLLPVFAALIGVGTAAAQLLVGVGVLGGSLLFLGECLDRASVGNLRELVRAIHHPTHRPNNITS